MNEEETVLPRPESKVFTSYIPFAPLTKRPPMKMFAWANEHQGRCPFVVSVDREVLEGFPS